MKLIERQELKSMIERAGFQHVRRYAGGIADWETAGYPLEGEFVDAGQAAAT